MDVMCTDTTYIIVGSAISMYMHGNSTPSKYKTHAESGPDPVILKRRFFFLKKKKKKRKMTLANGKGFPHGLNSYEILKKK